MQHQTPEAGFAYSAKHTLLHSLKALEVTPGMPQDQNSVTWTKTRHQCHGFGVKATPCWSTPMLQGAQGWGPSGGDAAPGCAALL